MKKTIFALISVSLIIFSCKKHHDDAVAPIADKPYTNTNDGTKWTYRVVTDSGLATQTALIDTVTITGVDTTINTKDYRIARHTNGNTESYFNVTANDYYQFQQVAAVSTQVEVLYLKDNLALNGTWTQDIPVTVPILPPPAPPTTITVTLTNKILEKGITKTVSGITYNDVITVQSTLTTPGITIVSDIKNYYARNIGLIESDNNIDVSSLSLSIHTNTYLQTADLH